MTSGFSFGTGSGGGFSFSAPTISTTSSAASTGFSFGLSTPPASTAATSSISGFSAGGGLTFPSFNTGTSTTTTPSATSSSSLGGFSFGAAIVTSANTSGSTSTASQPVSTPLFNFSSGSSSGANATGSTSSVFNAPKPIATTASTVTGGGFSFLTPAASTTPSSINPTPVAAAPAATFGTGTSAALSTATTTTTFGASGAGGQSSLSMRQLEEKLNKWLVELKEQEERFVRQAAHVNAWDQILQKGHDEVHSLKETLNTVKSDQSRLEAEIDFIRGQQDELERLLEPLETAANTNPATQMHQGDRQRDNMYYLAQSLDAQLRQMTDDLGKVIEHLNTTSSPSQPNDPVTLVTRILSAHMDTLKWIDQNAVVLSQKVEDVARITGNISKRPS